MKRLMSRWRRTLLLSVPVMALAAGLLLNSSARAADYDCYSPPSCPYHAQCTGTSYTVEPSCKYQCYVPDPVNPSTGRLVKAGSAVCGSGSGGGEGPEEPLFQ